MATPSCYLQLPDAVQEKMQTIYDVPSPDLLVHAEAILQDHLDPLRSFLAALSPVGNELPFALRAMLLLYTVTNGAKIPRQMQLKSLFPVMARLDSIINAGTGSGKTICMVLPVLLDPGTITLIISPLKRLQINQVRLILLFFKRTDSIMSPQVAEFAQYGIKAQCINSDTPDDSELWTVCFQTSFIIFV